jgi:8-oxo-dGTP pyrophosphatase MutT (NUDIX family)
MNKTITVVAGVIRIGQKVLLSSRPLDKPPYGLEFPGGKVEKKETLQQALERELKEELAFDVTALDVIYLTRVKNIKIWFIRCMPKKNSSIKPMENQSYNFYDLTSGIPKDLLPGDYSFWQFLASGIKNKN